MSQSKMMDLVFKIIVIGDSGSGKSCLLQRYLNNQFSDSYTVTLGVQYHSKNVKIDNQLSIKLQFWDTAGQQAFNSLVRAFYRNAHAVILLYDITRRQTFQNLDLWQQQSLQNAPQSAIYVLIGSHLDEQKNRQVSRAEAQAWIKQAGIQIFFQTSAKSSQNVSKAFDEVCKQLILKSMQKKKKDEQKLKLTHDKQQSNCC